MLLDNRNKKRTNKLSACKKREREKGEDKERFAAHDNIAKNKKCELFVLCVHIQRGEKNQIRTMKIKLQKFVIYLITMMIIRRR